jgi:hypothetical protein
MTRIISTMLAALAGLTGREPVVAEPYPAARLEPMIDAIIARRQFGPPEVVRGCR